MRSCAKPSSAVIVSFAFLLLQALCLNTVTPAVGKVVALAEFGLSN